MRSTLSKSFLLILLLLCGSVCIIVAQVLPKSNLAPEDIVDFEADRMMPISTKQNVIKLVGNVIFRHNGTILYCDSAFRYDNQHMDGFGKVLIEKGTTKVYGNSFTYNGAENRASIFAPVIVMIDLDLRALARSMEFNTEEDILYFYRGACAYNKGSQLEANTGYYMSNSKRFYCWDDVLIKDSSYLISSDSMNYYTEDNHIFFHKKAHIWNDKKEFLSSKKGFYDEKEKTYIFNNDAYIRTVDRELWGDSLKYNSITQEGELYKNIQVLDTANASIGMGDLCFYYGAIDKMLLTEKPATLSYDIETLDTAYLKADTIILENVSDSLKKFRFGLAAEDTTVYRSSKSYNNVALFRTDYQAVGDSMYSNTIDSTSQLFGEPLFWNDSSQLSSKESITHFKNEKLVKADFLGNAFVAEKKDSIHYNQTEGRNMFVYFRDNEAYQIDFIGRAQSLIFNEEDSVITSVVNIKSSDLSLYLENKEVTRIVYKKAPEYVMYPIDKIHVDEDFSIYLGKFNWKPEFRPRSKYDITTRTVRKSIRAETMKIIEPSFNTSNSLERDLKEAQTSGKVWY